MQRPQKITFGEMRESDVRGVLIYCSDYHCSHYITANADPWSIWWALIPGPHSIHATATLTDGTTQDSAAVPFTVTSYVPPDDRPASGEVK